MSQSTNAILFYGYHLPEGYEPPNEDEHDVLWDSKQPVHLDTHCSDGSPMTYVCWSTSQTTAWRGTPKPIVPSDMISPFDRADQIKAFALKHGIPLPGDVANPEYDDTKASNIGWWLVSYWG